MKERTVDHFLPQKKTIISLGLISMIHTLRTNRERRGLQELQKKFVDNVSVGILSSFFILSGSVRF